MKLEPGSYNGVELTIQLWDLGSSLWPEVCGIKTAIVQVAMHLQHGHKTRMSGPPAQHGLQAARKNIMKHTFKIIYETDGMPICPDAIHKQLDLAMDDIKKQFRAGPPRRSLKNDRHCNFLEA